jgi:hypothetical protein
MGIRERSMTAETTTGRWRRLRVEVLLALLVVAVAGPLVHEYKAQQASRYVFTAAIWDGHTIRLDDYAAVDPPVLGVDRAVKDGHTYSDKAPLQPVLAVPFYAVYRAVGGEPAIERRIDENLGLWWITFWMATVPAAILAALMYQVGRRYSPDASLPATVGLVFGSILLPFAAVLFGHSLVALLAFAGFAVLSGDVTNRRLVGAGALLGAAVAAEYTAAIAVVVVAGYALWRAGRRVVWFVAGGIPFAVGLGWYHTLAFGTPLTHPYRYSAFTEVRDEAAGLLENFSRFHPEHALQVFVDGRGFLIATPIVLVALVGLAAMIRPGASERRAEAVVSLVMFAGFLVIPLFWGNPWGGDSPGARYMTPALPFMVVGATWAFNRARLVGRLRAVVVAAAAIGIVTMLLATITDPLIPDEAPVSIRWWLELAVDGDIVPTVFTIAIGPLGWAVQAVLVVVVARALAVAHRNERAAAPAT